MIMIPEGGGGGGGVMARRHRGNRRIGTGAPGARYSIVRLIH